MKIQITEDRIESFEGCSYCGYPKGQKQGCCHEMHFEMFFDVNEEIYTQKEFNETFELVKSAQDCGCERAHYCEPEHMGDR